MFLISDLIRFGYMRDSGGDMPSSSLDSSKETVDTKPNDALSSPENKTVPSNLTVTSKTNSKKDNKQKYKCPVEGCNATFPRPWRLKNHVQAHNGEKTFKCTEEDCDKAYTSKSHLIRHVAQSHRKDNEQQRLMCDVSGCGKVLKTRACLLKHVQRFHTERHFECVVCSMKFRTEEQLESHSKNRHNYQTRHRCDRCNQIFLKLRHYNRHMRRHRMHICPQPSCMFVTEDYTQLRHHMGAYHPKVFQCDTCGKETTKKTNLRNHIKVHLKQAGLLEPQPKKVSPVKFTCRQCYLNLATKASLQRHVRLIHDTPTDLRLNKPVKCRPDRAVRKDKNIPKKSVASKLTSVKVPLNIEKAILNKETYSVDDKTSHEVYNLMIQDLRRTTEMPLEIDET